jgi:hypothetical protein
MDPEISGTTTKTRPPWLVPSIVAGGVIIILVILIIANSLGKSSRLQVLSEAASACGITSTTSPSLDSIVRDDGRTLILDGIGEESGSGSVPILVQLCVLQELNIPDAVMAQIKTTRALDGRQTASWGEFTASWTYHPKNGLDIIIELADK